MRSFKETPERKTERTLILLKMRENEGQEIRRYSVMPIYIPGVLGRRGRWRMLDSGSAKRAWWKCHFIRESRCKASKCFSPLCDGRTFKCEGFPGVESTIWTPTHFRLIKAFKLCHRKRRFVTKHTFPRHKSWIVFTSHVFLLFSSLEMRRAHRQTQSFGFRLFIPTSSVI